MSNTCAFDSLLVELTVGYIDIDNFRNYMDDLSTNNKFLKLCRDVALLGCSVPTYKTRAEILIDSGVVGTQKFSKEHQCSIVYQM